MDSGFNIGDEEQMGMMPIGVGSSRYCDCYRINRCGKWLFVKRLKAEYANDERCRQAFRKERELGIRIDHPNIVRYQLADDDISIVQDYVDGLSLDKFTESHPTYFHKKGNRQKFVDELLSAVECLHAHQVIHLDLKPQNIIITTQGNNVKLLDLGMAFHDTFTSTFGGTEGFSAPEVINGKGIKPTFAADIYSIGRLLDFVGYRPKSIARRCSMDDASKRYQSVNDVKRAISNAHRRYAWLSLAIAGAIVCIVGFLLIPDNETTSLNKETPLPKETTKISGTIKKPTKQTIPNHEVKKENANLAATLSTKQKIALDAISEENQRYDAAMKKIGEQLDLAQKRIYAPLDKALANPNYNDHYIYSKLKDIFIICNRQLQDEEKKIYAENGYSLLAGSYATNVWRKYNKILNKVEDLQDEHINKWQATRNATADSLCNQMLASVERYYADVIKLVASPPKSKEDFRKQYYALKEKADDAFFGAMANESARLGIRLSGDQSTRIDSKIKTIENKFYKKYNE